MRSRLHEVKYDKKSEKENMVLVQVWVVPLQLLVTQ
jgi:hypothetical protein